MEKRVSHYQYAHRLMRVFEYIKRVESKRKEELCLRSAMMASQLSMALAQKMVLEAGALSYLPQYSKFNKSEVTKLFGKDVSFLVGETDELRRSFVSGDVDVGCSVYSKNIYAFQCYIDLVEILTCSEDSDAYVDGILYKRVKGGFKVDGETHTVPEFHNFVFDLIRWKLEYLEYANSCIRCAMREVLKMYKDQKGFIFDVDQIYVEASEDQSPGSRG